MAETMDLDVEDTDSDEERLQSMSAGQRQDRCNRLAKIYHTLTFDYLIK